MKFFRKNNKELVSKRKKDYWNRLTPERKKEINERKRY